MKLITPAEAPKLRKPHHYTVVLCYAVIVVLVTTYGLFKFDELTEAVLHHNIAGGVGGIMLAVLGAGAGVFALPYLLRMRVSPLMRLVSAVAACAAPLGWLLAAWWIEVNLGGLDGLVALVVSYVSIALAVTSVWIVGNPLLGLKKRA